MKSFKRFLIGFGVGIFLAAIAWSYCTYFHVSISLVRGIVSSLLLAISCAIVATVSSIDKLMDNLPNI